MKLRFFLCLMLAIFSSNAMEAQIWKKFKKQANEKFKEKLEDKVVNEISEDLSNRAMSKVDKLYENLWRKSYNEANGEDLNEEEFEALLTSAGNDLNEALGELNKAADVPEQYEFNVIVDYSSVGFDGKELRSEMYFSRTEAIMGILVESDKGQVITVMDAERDLMVMYSDKNGKRSAQAIPALFTMATALSLSSEEAQSYQLPMSPTGKSKNIAGYRSKEYIGEDDESTFRFYMSNELPFDWRNSYGELLKSVIPKMYDENEKALEGMMMETSETQKDTGKKSFWKVNKISKMKTSLNKSEYEFAGI